MVASYIRDEIECTKAIKPIVVTDAESESKTTFSFNGPVGSANERGAAGILADILLYCE